MSESDLLNLGWDNKHFADKTIFSKWHKTQPTELAIRLLEDGDVMAYGKRLRRLEEVSEFEDRNLLPVFEIVGQTPRIDHKSLKNGESLIRIQWDEGDKQFVVESFQRVDEKQFQYHRYRLSRLFTLPYNVEY